MKTKTKSLLVASAVLVGGSFFSYQVIEAHRIETQLKDARRLKLSQLDTEVLDLAYLVNKVDELGGDTLQLNWKEIIAILAAIQENNVTDINEALLVEVASAFIQDQTVLSFENALERLNLDESSQQLAFTYLYDLTYIGYVPERLLPEAKETKFINQLIEPAKGNYAISGILPSITIAQAILESNWGTSKLATEASNLFGIKVGYGWTGESYRIDTLEFNDTWIVDDFRKYEDWNASIEDHNRFLLENPRYQNAGVFEAKTYRKQAQALQEAGYSTAQDEEGNFVYAKRLGELIRQYNLQLIDHEVLHP